MKKCIYVISIILFFLIIYTTMPYIVNFFADKENLPTENHKMLIVGHRGGAGMAPENSLQCIEKGIQTGADMIEIDIHLTKDGELVVCHDQTIDRTTTGTGKIAEMTLSEIRKFHIVDKNGKETDEKIPTLDEVLKLINGRCRLLIEIKRTNNLYQGIEQKLLESIKAHHASQWIIAQSFNDSVLETLHALDHTVRLEKLVIFKLQWIPVIFDGTFTYFSFKKYHYISSFNFHYRAITPALLKKIHAQGKEVKIWTLEEPNNWKACPVDGIITDRPDLWTTFFQKQ